MDKTLLSQKTVNSGGMGYETGHDRCHGEMTLVSYNSAPTCMTLPISEPRKNNEKILNCPDKPKEVRVRPKNRIFTCPAYSAYQHISVIPAAPPPPPASHFPILLTPCSSHSFLVLPTRPSGHQQSRSSSWEGKQEKASHYASCPHHHPDKWKWRIVPIHHGQGC